MLDEEMPRESILFGEMERSAHQLKNNVHELRISIGRKFILVRKAGPESHN